MFYTNVFSRGDYIYLRGFHNRKRVKEKIPFQPTLYVRTGKPTQYKTLHGESLDKIKFGSIKEAREFVSNYKEVSNFPIYGNTNYSYQFINQVFKGDIEFDMSLMKIVTIDIETTTEYGFPDPRTAQEEVSLITIQDFNTKQIITFGCKPYLPQKDNVEYVECKDEFELLRRFIDCIKYDYPDVITGWNVQLFDIAYLSSRIQRVLGDNALSQCSPHGFVSNKDIPVSGGRTALMFDWHGISILDYMDLYKKFSFKVQESYSLDYISKQELGKEKIKHHYNSFKEFYTKDWKLFVDYNIVDVELVDQLEDKMMLINLILTMAYDAKCNFMDIYSSVRTWDCIIYNALAKDNVIIPIPPEVDPASDRQILGAYVKDPKPSKHSWLCSFDATSLYPSIMMTFNMSPETLIDGEKHLSDDETSIVKLLEHKVDTSRLASKNATMVANGQCFSKEKKGILPKLIEYYFSMRQTVKKEMIKLQKKYEETKDESYLKKVTSLNSKQMAAKILMNSLYGASGNVFFRYYDVRIAEGITMTGQFVIRYVANKVNEYLNRLCKSKDVDYSFYSDTDSTYIDLGNYVDLFLKGKDKKQIVESLDQFCETQLTKIINDACGDIFKYLNVYQEKLSFKREVIADSGVWLAKKRYAINVHNSEGIAYDPPKLKVQGMEIVRSSTPWSVREALREAVHIVLTKDVQALKDFVADLEKKWLKLPYQDIAFPRTINGVTKYSDSSDVFRKGTPIHVRGALIHNNLIKQKKLEMKYQYILEGDKAKFLYLKEPNSLGSHVITFRGEIPPEFQAERFVDYETMFEKAFLEPLNSLVNTVGWQVKEQATLEGLFI